MAGSIKRLEEAVVNRIAAGEVIQRPANALKELLENSLDAGSTSIQVTVKNGGMKLLQIQDNGSGIKKEDLLIVCERFTTSKLEKFEDLTNINTYGFRGEALASISHVAHVTITTRVQDSKCAYKGSYCDGKLLSARPGVPPEPKPCAGNQGTLISVEDLFYNVPTRHKALKSPSEEYHKITDVVGKYAIHNAGVAFTLKKHGDSVADVRTSTANRIEDNISAIYGQSVARELLAVSCDNSKLGFKMNGFVTNANYSVKKLIFLLFINHRLVDSTSLRKAIEIVYSSYLPKNTHPFVYMSIEIVPNNVDVNVHPTKHEVHFLHEDLVTEAIQKSIEERLLGCNASRTYYTQALLPGAAVPISLEESATDKTDVKLYAHQMVRTDPKEQKLDAFLAPSVTIKQHNVKDNDGDIEESGVKEVGHKSIEGVGTGTRKRQLSPTYLSPSQRRRKHRRPVHLTSVRNLIQKVYDKQHKDLSTLFSDHKFVGCVDQTKVLLQHQTRLYLINVTRVTQELFYQLVLLDFANFSALKLKPPPSLYDLALVGLESPQSGWSEEDGPKESLAQYLVGFIKSKSEMLKDYFSFEIDEDGHVLSLPVLLEGYTPNIDKLPIFILRLATEVEWEEEEACFDTFARECSLLYCIEHDPFLQDKDTDTTAEDNDVECNLAKHLPWRWTIEHVVFPSVRCDLIPLKEMAEDGSVLQISDLKDLYKVFERC